MNYAIVTPSYAPDYERCCLLAESIDRYVSGTFHHYIFVEERDRKLFSSLVGPRRSLKIVNEIIPWWLKRLPYAKRWWFSFKTPPVRNWILQQIVKLSTGLALTEDVFVFSDSDMAFIRSFSINQFENDGKVRLYRVPDAAKNPSHLTWHRAASKLLGLPPTDYFGATYIGHPTIWRRDVLLKLNQRIAEVAGCSWQEALCWHWQFSEYILYGVFAEHILGESAGHFSCPEPISHNSWDYELHTDADLESYFAKLRPNQLAVMVSSKQYLPVERYRKYYDAIREPVGAGQPAEPLSLQGSSA